jgi:hypothetical protein
MITALVEDLDRLRAHVDEVAAAADSTPKIVLFRLDNIARAAALARSIPDGRGQVNVW